MVKKITQNIRRTIHNRLYGFPKSELYNQAEKEGLNKYEYENITLPSTHHLDADEVTQETFVRIYNRRDQLKNVDYFASFLMRIATNYAIDLIRWKQKGFISIDSDQGTPSSVSIELTDKANKPDQIFENKELLDRIKQAVKKLPPRQRVTVILHDLEGFSKREVAGILQCPQATVRSNLHIARTKLRKWLQKNNKGR